MNPHQLKRLFPHASAATLAANSKDYGKGIPEPVRPAGSFSSPVPQVTPILIAVTIHGQIRGGKNNMIVTKKGKHIPKKTWAIWRDDAVNQVIGQLPPNWEPISTPKNIRLDYVAGDRMRRDFPAILDAIFHVLEKAGFCVDDTLLWPTQSTRAYDKENPRATISVLA